MRQQLTSPMRGRRTQEEAEMAAHLALMQNIADDATKRNVKVTGCRGETARKKWYAYRIPSPAYSSVTNHKTIEQINVGPGTVRRSNKRREKRRRQRLVGCGPPPSPEPRQRGSETPTPPTTTEHACSVRGREMTTHAGESQLSCHVLSCHVLSCYVLSCHVQSCHVLSWQKEGACVVAMLSTVPARPDIYETCF